jgi:hypothetical protein
MRTHPRFSQGVITLTKRPLERPYGSNTPARTTLVTFAVSSAAALTAVVRAATAKPGPVGAGASPAAGERDENAGPEARGCSDCSSTATAAAQMAAARAITARSQREKDRTGMRDQKPIAG